MEQEGASKEGKGEDIKRQHMLVQVPEGVGKMGSRAQEVGENTPSWGGQLHKFPERSPCTQPIGQLTGHSQGAFVYVTPI